MDFSFTEEQEIFRKRARAFLAENFTKDLRKEMVEDDKDFPPALWKEMAGRKWLGLVIPEKYGGLGKTFMDLALLQEEMGRAGFLGPFFSTVILGALPILDAGSEEQKAFFLRNIASGNMILTLALIEPSIRYDASAITVKGVSEKDDYVINGTKIFVENAHIADSILCACRTSDGATPEEGITLLLVDRKAPGIRWNRLKTIGGDKQCEVLLDQARVPKTNLLGKLGLGWPIIQRTLEKAAVAKCAEMVGGSQQVLEMSVNYAKARKQFGRPIGSFQAIQHHCADMLIDVDGSKFITYEAAWKLSQGLPAAMEVAIAKAWVSEAYQRVVALGHQIHGGIGFCQSHDMPFYFKAAKVSEALFGDGDFHRWKVAEELGL